MYYSDLFPVSPAEGPNAGWKRSGKKENNIFSDNNNA
jgi:hypothetical protein